MLLRTPKNLGQLVRAGRLEKGWSQAALAKVAGTTQKQVSFVENGRPGTSVDLVLRLLGMLKVTLEGEVEAEDRHRRSTSIRLVDEVADRGRRGR